MTISVEQPLLRSSLLIPNDITVQESDLVAADRRGRIGSDRVAFSFPCSPFHGWIDDWTISWTVLVLLSLTGGPVWSDRAQREGGKDAASRVFTDVSRTGPVSFCVRFLWIFVAQIRRRTPRWKESRVRSYFRSNLARNVGDDVFDLIGNRTYYNQYLDTAYPMQFNQRLLWRRFVMYIRQANRWQYMTVDELMVYDTC